MASAKELRDMNDEELAHHLAETREELFSLRFQLAMGKQDNSARLGHVRREVARVLTVQTERQFGRSQPAVPASRTKGS
ncbi:MAG TPA: 50S ribosomal protein L29 [Acidimicrobiales bacterium]|nr:50S ribosomal protein L29 [Acidimicrobiales bacterium]